MHDQTSDFDSILIKTLPLAGTAAQLVFATLPGERPAQAYAHARMLERWCAKEAEIAGPEIYAGKNLDTCGFDIGGATRFFGTEAGGDFYRGMQACLLRGVHARPILLGAEPVGLFYEDTHARYAQLGGVFPCDVSLSRGAQTTDVFTRIEEALRSVGMDFSHVIRTWFYNDEILEWYGEFNRARDAFFNAKGVFGGLVPASTGVGSRNARGAALMARAFAVAPKDGSVRAKAVPSPLQCPAIDYRSSFSRAVELTHPRFRQLIVSGTASIEPGGKTAHVGDVIRQIELSLDVAESILHSRRMGWPDVIRAVAYLKDYADLAHFERVRLLRGLEVLPCVAVQSDVCRDDLLFEIELEAAVPSAGQT